MSRILVALLVSLAWSAAANAEIVRFVCTNNVGAPDRVEIDFGRNTALLFYKDDRGAIAPEEKSSPAKITATAVRWPDILDGTIYTMERSTGVFKKLFEGKPLYTKQCRKIAAGATWQ